MSGKRFLLGFDIGGTKCAAILGVDNGTSLDVIDKVKFATAEQGGAQQCIEKFCREMCGIVERNNVVAGDIAGLGISCGGPLDSRRGVVLSPPNLPGWDAVPVVELVEKVFKMPIRLQNDANACAVAEWKYGAGKGSENMVFLTFGTGLGAGLILNNRLYSGANDMAGECGHMRLSEHGPVGYGKAGSFEGFCSGGGIAQLAKSRLMEIYQRGGQVSWCDGMAGIAGVTAKTVGDAAEAGDELAVDIYRTSARYLGRGLSILIDILNPDMIVIGSVFARSEALFRSEMETVIRSEALDHAAKVCKVVPAGLGEKIGDIASLSLAAGGF